MITDLNFNCKRLWLSLLSTPTRNLKCESYRKCYSFPWHQLLLFAMHAKIINNKFYLGSLSFSLFDFSDVMDALDLSCSDRFIFRGWATMFPARNSSNVRCTSCIHKNAYSRKVARKLWSKSINISYYTTESEEQTEDTLGPFLERPGNFSGAKANFEIKTCWIVAQFLAHKPDSFASLTDSFIVLFSKLVKLWSWMQTRPANIKQLFGPEKLSRLSRTSRESRTVLWPQTEDRRMKAKDSKHRTPSRRHWWPHSFRFKSK